VEFRRDERKRRCLTVDDDRRQLVGDVRDPIAVEAQDVGRLLHEPVDGPGEHDGTERVEPELELGDDAEVHTASSSAPLHLLTSDPAGLTEGTPGGWKVSFVNG